MTAADDTRTEIAAVIESHLSTGIGCHCEKWKIDTSIRPVDPRKQHRGHVAEVLAGYVASKQAEALREAADEMESTITDLQPNGAQLSYINCTQIDVRSLRARADRIANPEAGVK